MAGAQPARQADVVLGEDWIGPDAAAESEARAKRDRRGVIAMNRSPLARKIITSIESAWQIAQAQFFHG